MAEDVQKTDLAKTLEQLKEMSKDPKKYDYMRKTLSDFHSNGGTFVSLSGAMSDTMFKLFLGASEDEKLASAMEIKLDIINKSEEYTDAIKNHNSKEPSTSLKVQQAADDFYKARENLAIANEVIADVGEKKVLQKLKESPDNISIMEFIKENLGEIALSGKGPDEFANRMRKADINHDGKLSNDEKSAILLSPTEIRTNTPPADKSSLRE